METIKKTVAAFGLALGLALSAPAADTLRDGGNPQVDPNVNGTNVCAFGTNTYSAAAFNTAGADVWIEGQFICTNANAMKAGDGPIIAFNGGMSSSGPWVTNAFQFLVPATGVNGTAVKITNLLAVQRFPWMQTYQIWNTNTPSGTNFTSLKVRVTVRPPLPP